MLISTDLSLAQDVQPILLLPWMKKTPKQYSLPLGAPDVQRQIQRHGTTIQGERPRIGVRDEGVGRLAGDHLIYAGTLYAGSAKRLPSLLVGRQRTLAPPRMAERIRTEKPDIRAALAPRNAPQEPPPRPRIACLGGW